MKRLTSKEILVESFHELAQTKNVDKITINDIVENCGYSTATFYRQFRDKYDLIAWDYARQVETIMFAEASDSVWKDTLLEGIRYYEANKDYIKNLILHTSGYESFLTYMSDINDSFLQSYIKKELGQETLDKDIQLYIHFYCHGTVAMVCDWLLGNIKVSDTQLATIFENAVPQPIQTYLLK